VQAVETTRETMFIEVKKGPFKTSTKQIKKLEIQVEKETVVLKKQTTL
jgi:hypothetical protein